MKMFYFKCFSLFKSYKYSV